MLAIDEALDTMLPAFRPLAAVRVSLSEAHGLFCAEPVVARFDLPAFDNSAMDGWAVRAADLAGARADAPASLEAAGESSAGGPAPPALAPGTAMRIFTGAPVPAGADTVVMQEDTAVEAGCVRARIAPERGAHVRLRGSDLRAGATVLEAGDRIGAGEIGLLASQGRSSVVVCRRPRVALLSTGDELRDVCDPDRPGSVVDSNAYALAAMVREAGGIPWVLPPAPDVRATLAERLRTGLEADVLISVGGVSVGDHDHVGDAMVDAGIQLDFHKVAIKPGKPITFGRAGAVPFVGLPGNPVSAMVTFEVFVRPGLRRMLGARAPFRPTIPVTLTRGHRHRPGRTELVRARLAASETGILAEPHSRQGSGSIPSMVGVDALVIVPAERGDLDGGDRLRALVLSEGRGAASSPFSLKQPGARAC